MHKTSITSKNYVSLHCREEGGVAVARVEAGRVGVEVEVEGLEPIQLAELLPHQRLVVR